MQRPELHRVVREQPQLPHAEVVQDLGADAVVAVVGLEAQLDVRLDGVQPLLVLQAVGADLVDQADAAALLAHVEDDAAPAPAICSCAARSWSPQSQRREPKTSPVRHSLWARTSTGSSMGGFGLPSSGTGMPSASARCGSGSAFAV